MNKIKILIISVIILLAVPLAVYGASTYKSVYYPALQGYDWNQTESDIVKISDPGQLYSFSDIGNYSAYITNSPSCIGKGIGSAFYWYNKSRLGYIKLFKVDPNAKISFLFSEDLYVYCAEFDKNFKLVYDGTWNTTGDVQVMGSNTQWIMCIFRTANGNLSDAAGIDTTINATDISSISLKYIIFKPFTYTFNLNGGTYNGSTTSFTAARYGVESMTLASPARTGYTFGGWKTGSSVYSGTLPKSYDSLLFKDVTFTALWNEIEVKSIKLNQDYAILEENAGETTQLTATITPSDALDQNITWSTSDSSVAIVDSNGKVTGLSGGTAIITARADNGIQASCRIFVMSFEISLPEYCKVNDVYKISVKISNNGNSSMTGRKKVILDMDNIVDIIRVDSKNCSYNVIAESSTYNGDFTSVGDYVVNTSDSVDVYIRMVPKTDIEKAGDYEGVVNFSVKVV